MSTRTLLASMVRIMCALLVSAGVGCGPTARESGIAPSMPELSRGEAVGLLARLYAQEDGVILRAMEEIAAVGDSRSWPRLSIQKCSQAGAPAVPDFLCFEVEGASLRFNRERGERWQRGFASIRETEGEARVMTVARALDRVLELLHRDALRELSADDAHEASTGLVLAGAEISPLSPANSDLIVPAASQRNLRLTGSPNELAGQEFQFTAHVAVPGLSGETSSVEISTKVRSLLSGWPTVFNTSWSLGP
jgi:hypothetical protein